MFNDFILKGIVGTGDDYQQYRRENANGRGGIEVSFHDLYSMYLQENPDTVLPSCWQELSAKKIHGNNFMYYINYDLSSSLEEDVHREIHQLCSTKLEDPYEKILIKRILSSPKMHIIYFFGKHRLVDLSSKNQYWDDKIVSYVIFFWDNQFVYLDGVSVVKSSATQLFGVKDEHSPYASFDIGEFLVMLLTLIPTSTNEVVSGCPHHAIDDFKHLGFQSIMLEDIKDKSMKTKTKTRAELAGSSFVNSLSSSEEKKDELQLMRIDKESITLHSRPSYFDQYKLLSEKVCSDPDPDSICYPEYYGVFQELMPNFILKHHSLDHTILH